MTAGRVLRFAAVGLVNTGVYYGGYLVLRQVVPYLLAHLSATFIAMVGSYFLNCYVTFRTAPRLRSFLLFPLSNVANVVFTTVGLHLAVARFGLDERIAPLPIALAAIPVTYVVASQVMVGRLAPSSAGPPP